MHGVNNPQSPMFPGRLRSFLGLIAVDSIQICLFSPTSDLLLLVLHVPTRILLTAYKPSASTLGFSQHSTMLLHCSLSKKTDDTIPGPACPSGLESVPHSKTIRALMCCDVECDRNGRQGVQGTRLYHAYNWRNYLIQ